MINLIAIDDQIMLDGLKALFEDYKDIRMTAYARSYSQAIEIIDDTTDVILMDIDLEEENGMELSKAILQNFPGVKIIGFSMHGKHQIISSFMKIGCHGYVNKLSGENILINAIRSVYNGNLFLSSKTVQSMADLMSAPSTHDNSLLTPREREILVYLSQDYTLNQIAEELFISRSTAESHKRNLMLKLEVRTIAGLTRYALKNKLIEV